MSTPAKILITPRALTRDGHPALERLRAAGYTLVFCTAGQTPSEAELMQLVPDCVGWLAGVEPVSVAVADAARSLKAVSRNGTGVHNLPIDALKQRGVAILRAEGANARGVAELAITLMLTALRHVPAIDQGMKAGNWLRLLGREIEGRNVAIIGYGRIGGEVARMACALGARVRAHDPFITQPARPIGDFTWYTNLDLLDGADVVSLHAPGRSDGQPLMGAPELTRLAHGAVVLNTARASLVGADAMLDALDAGQIGVYATDVFEQEPPLPSPLLAHPNVIRTSHIGGYTEESVARATSAAVDNLLRALGPA
ncbi:MAG: NAD(P)-dependent oxidoreductase [Propionivibrio sp.]